MRPTAPENAQNRYIPRYNKKTKQLLFIQVWSLLLVRPKASEIRLLFRNWGTSLKFAPPKALSLDPPLMAFSLSVDIFYYKNRLSKAKVKKGRQVIRYSLTFRNAPTSMTL